MKAEERRGNLPENEPSPRSSMALSRHASVTEESEISRPGCVSRCGRAGRDRRSDDRSLLVHSHGGVLPRECVACVIVGSEIGAEYTESSGVAW